MDIQFKILTYRDIKKGVVVGEDSYKIGEYIFQGNVKNTLINSPIQNDNEPCAILALVDGVIAGRSLKFLSRLKIDNEVINVTSGSSLYVEEKYRHLALGANLFLFAQQKMKKPILNAGISKMALPLYEKSKFTLLQTPIKSQIRNIMPILKRLGIKTFLCKIAGFIINPLIRIYIGLCNVIVKGSMRNLTIKRLHEIPQWAEDIVLSDKHKYAEYHDRKWMQWVIDNNFFEREKDTQAFYGIFKDENPIGFFIITERQVNLPQRNIDSLVFGSIIEWDTVDPELLSEYQIFKSALTYFSDNVDIVNYSTTDINVQKKMWKFGFFNRGLSTIAFKDTTKQMDKDYKNIENWRVRSSYADTPFY